MTKIALTILCSAITFFCTLLANAADPAVKGKPNIILFVSGAPST